MKRKILIAICALCLTAGISSSAAAGQRARHSGYDSCGSSRSSGKEAFRLTLRVLDRLLDDCHSNRCRRQVERKRRQIQRQARRRNFRHRNARHHGRDCRDCLVIRW